MDPSLQQGVLWNSSNQYTTGPTTPFCSSVHGVIEVTAGSGFCCHPNNWNNKGVTLSVKASMISNAYI